MSDPSELLSTLQLRKSADIQLKQAVKSGCCKAFQKAWIERQQKAHRRYLKLAGDIPSPALWSADTLSDSQITDSFRSELKRLRKLSPQRKPKVSEDFLALLISRLTSDTDKDLLAVLIAGELLLRSPDQLSPELFVQLVAAVAKFEPDYQDDGPFEPQSEPGLIAFAIQQAEIPWMLGLILAPLKPARALLQFGKARLTRLLEDGTDTDGTLHAALATAPEQWLAPLVRASVLADAFDTNCRSRTSEERWTNVVRYIVATATPAGFATSSAACHERALQQSCAILQLALRTSAIDPSSSESSLLKSLTRQADRSAKAGKKKKTRKSKKADAARLGKKLYCSQSDWAATAIMRTGMHVDADVASLTWDDTVPATGLVTLGSGLLSGTWTQNITVDGQPVVPTGDWGCTCWFSDKEVAFVELEQEHDSGLRCVRHVMLSMKDHFAVISETVTTSDDNPEADLKVESRLHLASGISSETNSVTRELLLHGDCITARAIPAWLDDDRVINAAGTFHQDNSTLLLSATGRGGITMPLVLDWHPERKASNADWNRLTVTEARVVMSGHQASGHRVRVGRHQLLLYRSLQPGQTLRAVLGHHTLNETVYGTVRNSGDIRPLVLVDGNTED
jgi:hypothetical protein